MRPANGEKTYALISSQLMVRYMWKYSVHRQATQIPCAIAFPEELDFRVLARAVNVEIERNDCLRLRLFKKRGEIKQFFLTKYALDRVPVRDFGSKEELDAYFTGDARRELDVFGGETFRVVFFRIADGRSGVYLLVSHMVMDAAATYTFFSDLIAVYDAMRTGSPMPRALARYEDVIAKELSDPGRAEYIAGEIAALESFVTRDGAKPVYCDIKGAGAPGISVRKRAGDAVTAPAMYFPLADRSDFVKLTVGREESAVIKKYAEENSFSPEWVIQAGLRAYLGRINGSDDTYIWSLCARRRTVSEKRCGGTLASPLPWREKLSPDMTFADAVRRIAESQSFLFRHTDVPFTDMRAMERRLWDYNVLQTVNSMMFSYLPPMGDRFGGREYEYLGFSMSRYCMPLYVVTTYDAKNEIFRINYIHRLSAYSRQDIEAFHAGAAGAIFAGASAPEKTLREITEG